MALQIPKLSSFPPSPDFPHPKALGSRKYAAADHLTIAGAIVKCWATFMAAASAFGFFRGSSLACAVQLLFLRCLQFEGIRLEDLLASAVACTGSGVWGMLLLLTLSRKRDREPLPVVRSRRPVSLLCLVPCRNYKS